MLTKTRIVIQSPNKAPTKLPTSLHHLVVSRAGT